MAPDADGDDTAPDEPQDPHTHLARDEVLAPLVEGYGPLELDPAGDPFERLVVSLVNQQLSSASAAAIRERLFDRFDVTPAGMLAADEAALRDVGLSGQKIDYVRSAARAAQEGRLDGDRFAAMDDAAVVADLTDIRGVGDWTGKMFAMFVLGREDVFPVEDLGIRRAMESLCGDLSRAEMRQRAEPWRPFRSYAALYLWHHHEDGDPNVPTDG
ncbi:DNA-3-methyladenine glycosylase family protein [Haloglomus litoreum]|uniref:DNA-3-methyladenine glycosylase family protein n=1 Tax=Haloglomus litoreum TaxID=3034026 RepID=UPI0023E8FB78|nr:DNA-3-methyladenine glycosylase 2 family protein [Haloglomus sp. DT116]